MSLLLFFAMSQDALSFMRFMFSSRKLSPQGIKGQVEGARTPWLNEPLSNHARLETSYYSTSSRRVEHGAQLPIPATFLEPWETER
jgi:hypothetical protein